MLKTLLYYSPHISNFITLNFYPHYPRYFTFEITFIFNSLCILVTYKRDLVLYRALLIVYNTLWGSA